MNRPLVLFVSILVALIFGYITGMATSIPVRKDMQAEHDIKVTSLLCQEGYRNAKRVLGHCDQLLTDAKAQRNKRAIKELQEIQTLTEKEISTYDKECRKR